MRCGSWWWLGVFREEKEPAICFAAMPFARVVLARAGRNFTRPGAKYAEERVRCESRFLSLCFFSLPLLVPPGAGDVPQRADMYSHGEEVHD